MAGLILAALGLFWPVLVLVWKALEDVSSTTYHSPFFHVLMWANAGTQIVLSALVLFAALAPIGLAWLTLGASFVVFVWEVIESPFDITYRSRFYQFVHVTVGLVALVCALIVVL